MVLNHVNFYIGKLGDEHRIFSMPDADVGDIIMSAPVKKELVCLPVDPDGKDDECYTYVVKQVMRDYINGELSVFLEPYNWEF